MLEQEAAKMEQINVKNFEEKLKPFFLIFPDFQKNYCEKCIGLMDNNLNNCKFNVHLMDTGKCSNCGKVCEVINPFIYATATLNNLEIYGKAHRIFHTDFQKK